MAQWSNWSGKITSSPRRIVQVATAEAIRAELILASQSGYTVRTLGTGHSHYQLIPTSGVILDTRPLSGLVSVNKKEMTATFRGGTKIHACGRPLHDHGLALINQGDIDDQTIAGSIATGTHGTGIDLGSITSYVTALKIILVDGSEVECSASKEPDLFQAARLSLGAVGIVTEVTLKVREAYRLEEQKTLTPIDDVMENIDYLTSASRHFEYFWYPGRTEAICKATNETEKLPIYPIGEEGNRRGWNFEVLSNQRLTPHTEMEYAIPSHHGPSCIHALRDLIKNKHKDIKWPVEYRKVKADDLWISPARGRKTVTISIHQAVDKDEEKYYRDAEEIFRGFEGRPHWGKVHYLSGNDLMADYDRWSDWWEIRDLVDPKKVLINEQLSALRPE
jgi:FAD/FMN-containing dehydrogenase